MRTGISMLVVAALAAVCGGNAAGCTVGAQSDARRCATMGSEVSGRDGIERIRHATSAFHSLDAAVEAGYPRTVAQCMSHPEEGAMGFHHLNRALLDAHVELERPEILLYSHAADGGYVLNGVEYVVPYAAHPPESAPPTVLGQPLRRSDGLRIWYLHVWAWTENPSGMFADWNPNVSCDAAAEAPRDRRGRVFGAAATPHGWGDGRRFRGRRPLAAGRSS